MRCVARALPLSASREAGAEETASHYDSRRARHGRRSVLLQELEVFDQILDLLSLGRGIGGSEIGHAIHNLNEIRTTRINENDSDHVIVLVRRHIRGVHDVAVTVLGKGGPESIVHIANVLRRRTKSVWAPFPPE